MRINEISEESREELRGLGLEPDNPEGDPAGELMGFVDTSPEGDGCIYTQNLEVPDYADDPYWRHKRHAIRRALGGEPEHDVAATLVLGLEDAYRVVNNECWFGSYGAVADKLERVRKHVDAWLACELREAGKEVGA